MSANLAAVVRRARLGAALASHAVRHRPMPIAVVWKITGRCDLACAHCDSRGLKTVNEVGTETALRLIDQMHQAGVRLVSITGGEPLVREDIGDIVRRILDKGIVCKMNTTGMRLASVLAELRGLDLLQLSMDGPRDVHDRVRGAGTFDALQRAVRMAREAGIPTHLVCVLNRFNATRVEETLECARAMGVRVQFQPMVETPESRPGFEAFHPDSRDAVLAWRQLARLRAARHGLGRTLKNSMAEIEYYARFAETGAGVVGCSLVMATLDPDGRMSFCGRARPHQSHDAVGLGFVEAFLRLRIPDCDGCTCIGRLRFSRLARLDPAALREAVRD